MTLTVFVVAKLRTPKTWLEESRKISVLEDPFLKVRLNLKHFEKKDDPHSFCSSEITDSKNAATKMSKSYSFSGPFGKQHGKRAQALLKYASEQLHHFY